MMLKENLVFTRTYTINNVPSDHPIAFLNKDISNVVTYTGNTLYDIKEVDGFRYNFYVGTVTLNVTGSFLLSYQYIVITMVIWEEKICLSILLFVIMMLIL